jgi:hypothetical protein
MTKFRNYLFMGVAAVALAACQHNHTLRQGFGNTSAHNNALQVVDPNPVTANAGAPNLNGRRAAVAIENYETNEVIELEVESTTDEDD